MATYSDRRLMRAGAATAVALALAMVLAFNLQKLPGMKGTTYHARFSDASGLHTGDRVEIAGVRVGRVDKITIAGSGDASFASDGTVDATVMGSGNVNVTGSAKCTIHSMGSGKLNCTAGTTSTTGGPPAPPAPPTPPAAPTGPGPIPTPE